MLIVEYRLLAFGVGRAHVEVGVAIPRFPRVLALPISLALFLLLLARLLLGVQIDERLGLRTRRVATAGEVSFRWGAS